MHQPLGWRREYIEQMSIRMSAEHRRAQLLDAAIRVAENHGLAAVTIRRVAEEARVSLGVVHYCFTDKNELIGEVIRVVNADIHAAADAFLAADFDSNSIEAGHEALSGLLLDAFHMVWEVVISTPNRQLLIYEITSSSVRSQNPAESRVAVEQYEGFDRTFRAVLDRCGELTGMAWGLDVELVVRRSVSLIAGVALRWLLDRDTELAERIVESGLVDVANSAIRVEQVPGEHKFLS